MPVAHSHDGYEETIYGLEGVLTWTLDGRQIEVGPGQVLCIPRGAVHRFENVHDANAKMLAIVTPGILGPDFFREMAAVIGAAAGGRDLELTKGTRLDVVLDRPLSFKSRR